MSRYGSALAGVLILFLAASLQAKDLPQDIQTLLQQEQYSAAVGPLKEYVAKEKKSVEGWTALGFAYFFTEQDPLAQEAFEKALGFKKKHWPAVHGLVRVLTRLGDFEPADERVRWAIDNTKKEAETQAMFYHDLGLLQH